MPVPVEHETQLFNAGDKEVHIRHQLFKDGAPVGLRRIGMRVDRRHVERGHHPQLLDPAEHADQPVAAVFVQSAHERRVPEMEKVRAAHLFIFHIVIAEHVVRAREVQKNAVDARRGQHDAVCRAAFIRHDHAVGVPALLKDVDDDAAERVAAHHAHQRHIQAVLAQGKAGICHRSARCKLHVADFDQPARHENIARRLPGRREYGGYVQTHKPCRYYLFPHRFLLPLTRSGSSASAVRRAAGRRPVRAQPAARPRQCAAAVRPPVRPQRNHNPAQRVFPRQFRRALCRA